MSRFHSYLNSAVAILDQWEGHLPFAEHLRQSFKADHRLGSTDRKVVSSLCFAYFRAGVVFHHLGKDQAILTGRFLTTAKQDALLDLFHPEWAAWMEKPLEEKLAQLTPALTALDFLQRLFPLHEALSEEIDFLSFGRSLLRQPSLYIRLRPGKDGKVMSVLASAGTPFRQWEPAALELPPATVMDNRILVDKDVVIQDLSSQRVACLFPAFREKQIVEAWDCCAGSGGKSLLAVDTYPVINLTVTDSRESILRNLDKRFRAAGIREYRKFIIDLTDPRWPVNVAFQRPGKGFDLVIADVPCSGSGTWARNPEQLTQVRFSDLGGYVQRQQRIIRSVLPFVAPGGYLLYLTCSAFTCENEAQVEFILSAGAVQLVEQRLFSGYAHGADTMFGALFRAL